MHCCFLAFGTDQYANFVSPVNAAAATGGEGGPPTPTPAGKEPDVYEEDHILRNQWRNLGEMSIL